MVVEVWAGAELLGGFDVWWPRIDAALDGSFGAYALLSSIDPEVGQAFEVEALSALRSELARLRRDEDVGSGELDLFIALAAAAAGFDDGCLRLQPDRPELRAPRRADAATH